MTYKYNPFAAAYPSDRGPLGKIFLPAIDYRTYFRAGHMLLMFPLGIAYFVFFVVTLAVGGSMIWTLVGPIVLIATLFVSRWLGDLEAYTAGYVNGSTIRRPPFRLEGVSGFRSQVKVRIVDPTTWTGLIYLVVQFPIGIAAFVALVAGYAFIGASLFSPVAVTIMGQEHFWDFIVTVKLIGAWQIDLNTFPGSLVPIPIGILGFVLASHLVLAFSSLHGWWAKLMLGSRSNRVSSRPAPAPEGDEPPKPTTSAEPMVSDANAVAIADAETETELPQGESAETEPNTEPDVESPKTAARSALVADQVPSGTGEPFLRPVPNPAEITTEIAAEIVPDLVPIAELTTREQEVFMLMAHGDTNADIAEELFISEGTVKTHVKRVLSKLYMRDRTQVVVFAYEKGIVLPGAVVGFGVVTENRSYGG
jgi:DNA-binding CsgD family transcriptional regulator